MAFLTACGIGANDVANAFATSVGAGTLSLLQAVIIAAFCEFLGAFLLGGRVAAGIQKVIVHDLFAGEPEVLMVGFLVADFTTGLWLLMATRCSMPVSATHSVIGALIGFLIAAKGGDAVYWLQVLLVIITWFSAPICAGAVMAVVYWLLRRLILTRDDSYARTLKFVPLLVCLTLWVNLFFMMYLGNPNPDEVAKKIHPGLGLLLTLLVAGVLAALWECLVMPCIVRSTNRQYATMQKIRRLRSVGRQFREEDELAAKEKEAANVQFGTQSPAEPDAVASSTLQCAGVDKAPPEVTTEEAEPGFNNDMELLTANCVVLENIFEGQEICTVPPYCETQADEVVDGIAPRAGVYCSPAMQRLLEMSRVDEDPHDSATSLLTMAPIPDAGSEVEMYVRRTVSASHLSIVEQAMLTKRTKEMHDKAPNYNEKTELLFQFLQVISACFDSLAHGANSVATATFPFASILAIYKANSIPSTPKASMPWWIAALGGAGIVVGLCMYGSILIQAIGIKLARITPARGFCVEICTAAATITCSLIGVPISTTHCQIGATVALGWMDSKKDGVDWRLLATVFLGWILTLLFPGLISGLLFSAIVYSPTARLS